MTRIAVITDVHANLPALRAALEAIRGEGCDHIYHTGDSIGLGPFPAETLDLLLDTPNLVGIMGNHDAYFAYGLEAAFPDGIAPAQVEHEEWTHAQIDPGLRSTVLAWPYTLEAEFDGVPVLFTHYARDPQAPPGQFLPMVKSPTPDSLDELFAGVSASLVFHGHNHPFTDLAGRARYINPGSLGCFSLPIARYAVIQFQAGQYTVEYRQIPYDDHDLYQAFESRRVPERDVIYRKFFGGRFQPDPDSI